MNGNFFTHKATLNKSVLHSATILAVVLLTGCGSDNKDNSKLASSPQAPTTQTEASQQTTASAGGTDSSRNPAPEPGLAPPLSPGWTRPTTAPAQVHPIEPDTNNGSIPGQRIDDDPAPYVLPNLAEDDDPQASVPVIDDSAPNTADTQEIVIADTPSAGQSGTSATSNLESISQKFVRPNPSGFRWTSTAAGQVYGPGVFTQTTLANTIIGVYKGVENVVVNRFRALEEGQINKVRLYWQGGPGYSSGTGGRIRLTILPDDNTARHLPDFSAQPLADGSFSPDMSARNSIFPETALAPRGEVKKGQLYHLVLQNIDANPAANYVSSNNAAAHMSITRPSRWISNTDWGTLMGKRLPGATTFQRWINLSEEGSGGHFFSPILQLTFSNGKSMGVSDMESGSVDPGRVYTITLGKPAREHFTITERKRINGISVATAASKPGQLKWRLVNGTREIAWGYIKAANANYKTVSAKKVQLAALKWYDIVFPAGRYIQLEEGQDYDLEFSVSDGSEWKFADHRNGSAYGFTWPAAFTESQAQHFNGGRWLDTNHWNYSSNKRGSNWPVVLHLTR